MKAQQFLMPGGISDKLMGLYQLCGSLLFSPVSSSCLKTAKRILALVVLFSFLVWNISPVYGFDAQFVEGSGTIETNGNTTTVTVNGPAVMEGNMSIPEFNTVQVIQGSNDLLMRDITGMRTDWLGSLIADGRIVLVNTQGVFIASTANIDVKSLIASTLNIDNELFMNNQLHFEKVVGMDAAKILNEANITIKEGQSLVFLADAIENRGNITAYLGTVAMGVGTKATVSFDAGGMINLVVDQGLEVLGVDAQGNVITPLLNTGTISADGGKVQMSAKMLNATMDQLINNAGVIEATKVLEHDGMVEFVSNGAIVNEGTLRSTIVEEKGATFRSSGIMEVGEMMMDNLDGAADISGSIAGTYSDVGNIRMAGNVTLTGATTLRADSNNDGVGKVDMQTFAISGGANNLTLYTGESTTLNSITTTGTLSIYASTGNPTYTVGTNLSIGALSLYSGTLDMNGNNLTLAGAYTQSGGTFYGRTGAIDLNNTFALSGGTFNATSGSMNFNNHFTISGTGNFVHNNGTLIFDGTSKNMDVLSSLELYDFEVKASSGFMYIATGDTIVVKGALTLSDGMLYSNGGTLNAKGAISVRQTFDGGYTIGSINLLIDGTIDQSFTIPDGALMPSTTLNNSSTTITATSGSTLTFTSGSSLTLQSGTFDLNGANLVLNGTYTQSGGTFYGRTGSIDLNGDFTLSAGTFNAPHDPLGINGKMNFAGNFTISGPFGDFVHNNGTLIFDGSGKVMDVLSALDLYNFEMKASSNYMGIAANDTIVVNHALTLTDGMLHSPGGGTLNAKGSISVAPTFDGGYPSSGLLLIDGEGNQSFTIPNGALMPKTTLNSSLTTITVESGSTLIFPASSPLILQSGTFDLNGANATFSGGFAQTGGVFYGRTGVITSGGTFSLLGGSFTNSTADTMTVNNFILSNGAFLAPSNIMTVSGNFTVNGTGDFLHNDGKVIFNGSDATFTSSTPLSFNDFEMNASNFMRVENGTVLVVNGDLTLTKGALLGNSNNGTMNAKGDISVASTFGGGYSSSYSCNLLIDDTDVQNIMIAAGAKMPKTTLNNPLATLSLFGPGTVTWNDATAALSLQAGTVDLNGGNATFAGSFTQTGGVFYGRTGVITSGNTFSLLGGSFTNSTADTMTVNDLLLSNGAFLAPSGIMTITGNFTINGNGDFQHNDGKVIFSGTDKTFTSATPIYFNDFEMNAGSYLRVQTGTVLVVNGDLTLTKGSLLGWSNNGMINAKGDISVASTFGGGYVSGYVCNLLVDGSGEQNITIAAGAKMPKTTLNNPLAVLSLSGPGTVTWNDTTGGTLTLQDGTVDLNGGSAVFSKGFSQSGGVFYGRTGTISATTFDLSGGTFNAPTGTFTLSSTYAQSGGTFNGGSGAMTIAGVFTQSGGVFDAGTRTVNLSGNFTLSGGTFKTGTNRITFGDAAADTVTISGGVLEIQSDDTTQTGDIVKNASTWTNSGGTILYDATSSSNLKIRSGLGTSYYNLTINASGLNYTLDGNLDVNGNFTIGAGTGVDVSASNYNMTVAGNWSNSGAFTPRSGTVTLDGTNQSITGSTTFNNLTKNITTMDTLTFQAGSTQTVAGALTLTGALGQQLSLASSTPGSFWYITPSATRTISNVDVMDSYNNGAAISVSSTLGSITNINSGHNENWSFGAPARYTWIGAGADNNWSTSGNWQDGYIPGTGNTAIFSADSAKDCTINIATIGDVYISAGYSGTAPGYTGTLTQAGNLAVSGLTHGFIQRGGSYVVDSGTMTLNKAFTLAGGTFDLGSNALTTATSITFAQSGGTFAGGSGVIDLHGNFVLSGGTFNAPGRLVEGGPQGVMNFNSNFTVSGAGNFVHNNGALIFDGATKFIDVVSPLGLYDFEVKASSATYLGIAAGDTVIVNGALTLKEGTLYGPSGTAVLNAKGAISVASTFDGNNASGSPYLLIDGSGNQSFTIPAGAMMPKILLNNPLTTITATAGSTLTLPVTASLTIQSGTFDLNGANLVLTSGSYAQSGGTFYGRTGSIDLNGDFTLSGGTFYAPGRLIEGGPQGVMNFMGNFTVSGAGNFVHNNGSLIFDGANKIIDFVSSLDLYDFEVKATSGYMAIAADDTVIVNGALTLTNGTLYGPSGTGVLNAKGAISVASTFDGGNGSGSPCLLIDGPGNQSFTIPGGALMPKTTLNNPLTTITVESGGTITFPSANLLTLQSGIFDLNGGSVTFSSGFTQTGGVFYGRTGVINSSDTFSLLGGSFFNTTGNITVANFLLSSGTFLASPGTMTVVGNFTVDGTGDFQHNNGKVIFSGTDKTFTSSTPIHFNDFEMNAGAYLRVASGTTLVTNGLLTLTKGIVLGNSDNGTINAKGDISVAATFGGGLSSGSYTCNLLIDGTGFQNITVAVGAKMPKTTLNNSLATLSLSGPGTAVTWNDASGGDLILQAGTVDLNGGSATFSGGFSQSGGDFYGRTGAINTTTLSLSGGAFNAGSGNMTISGIFTLSGGTYNSTSGTQTQTGAVTVSGGTYTLGSNSTIATLTIGANGTFDLNGKNLTTTTFTNGGILKLQGGETVSTAPTLQLGSNVIYTKTNGSVVVKDWSYQNLTFDGVGGTFLLPSDKVIPGILTVNAGVFDQGARSLTAKGIVIGSQGAWVNNSTGDITVGIGEITNNGYIRLDGSGVGPGNDADAIVIRSTSDGTQRTWTGSGIFRVIDVDVRDQGGTVTAYSSTNSGNTDWTFEAIAPTEKTWIGNGADSNWTTGANWLEGEAPIAGETAIFDILGTDKPVTINVATVHGIQVNVGYTGTLTQASDLEIGLGHYQQSGATYSAGTYTLTLTGEFNLTGGSFTAPSSTLIVSRDFSITGGSFNANNGNILFNGVTFLKSNGTTFNNMQVGTDAVAATVLLQDNLKVGGDLQVGSLGLLNAVSQAITESGDWYSDNIINLGAVTLTGMNKTIYSGAGSFVNLTVSGSYALNDALTATGELTVSGTLDAAGKAISEGGHWTADQWTKITNLAAVTLSGIAKSIDSTGHSFNDLTIATGKSYTLNDALSVNGNLNFNGATLTGGANTITVGGNISLGTLTGSPVTLTGAGNTITSNGRSFVSNLNIEGSYALTDALSVSGDLLVPGTLNAAGKSITERGDWHFDNITNLGAVTLAGANKTIYSGANNFSALTVSGSYILNDALTVSGELTTSGSLNVAGKALSEGGNWSFNGLSNLGDVTLTGSGKTITSGANSFGNVNINGSYALSDALTATGELTVGGTLNAATKTISEGGNWSFAGLSNLGDITLTGSGKTITSGVNSFSNLIVNGSYALSDALTVIGELAVNGALDAASKAITEGGNWSFAGLTNLASVTLTGSGKAITSTGHQFNDVTVSGTYSLADALSVGGVLSVAGTLDAVLKDMSFAGSLDLTNITNVRNVALTGIGALKNASKVLNDLTVSGAYTLTDALSVGGVLSVAGTLDAALKDMTLAGSLDLTNITNFQNVSLTGTGSLKSAGKALNDLAVSGTYSLTDALSVGGVLSVAGTLDAALKDMTLAGSLDLTNITNARNVSLAGSGTLKSVGKSLNDVTVLGAYALTDAVTAFGDLDVQGTLDAAGMTISEGGNWSFSNITNLGAVALTGAGTITSNGNSFSSVTISGNYVQADGMNTTGIFELTSGSFTSDPAHSFGAHDFRLTGGSFDRYGAQVGGFYQVRDMYDLQAMKTHLSSDFQLTANLDATAAVAWNAAAGFDPIGTLANPFSGIFDGNEKIISNLEMHRAAEYSGLFGHLTGSVESLGLEEVNVYGAAHTGGLAGLNAGAITNVYITGIHTVSGTSFVGGLAGENTGTIANSYSIARVVGTSSVGGLVGAGDPGLVTSSFWDKGMSGQENSAGGTGGRIQSYNEILEPGEVDLVSKTTYAGWDMMENALENTGIWAMDDGGTYPVFRSQYQDAGGNFAGIRGIWGTLLDDSGLVKLPGGMTVALYKIANQTDPLGDTPWMTLDTGGSSMFYTVVRADSVNDTDWIVAKIVDDTYNGSSRLDVLTGSVTDLDIWGSLDRILTRPSEGMSAPIEASRDQSKMIEDLSQAQNSVQPIGGPSFQRALNGIPESADIFISEDMIQTPVEEGRTEYRKLANPVRTEYRKFTGPGIMFAAQPQPGHEPLPASH